MYALAFDLGTTTLAGSLIDIATGKRLAMTGSMNPQRSFGADVVSRLAAGVGSDQVLHEMSRMIRDELWRLANQLCLMSAIPIGRIRSIAIAGNPAMQHILLELPLTTLAFPPYRPLFTEGIRRKATELSWNCAAEIYLFPMPGGFVGGDTVAFLYGQHFERTLPSLATPRLYLDMGTNGEIALVSGDLIWATSAAAGPAFEGGNLSCGMVALPGAINSVQLDDERVKLTTIGNNPPLGICGSAALQAITELLKHDIIEPSGRLRDNLEIPSNLATRILKHLGENAFVLHRDARQLLAITQRDIRQIQLAKSALRAGIEVVGEHADRQLESLSEVVLTGSFGAVLQPGWLKSIGIFDEGMVQSTRFTPEGALVGAEQALAASDDYVSVEQLGKQFKVIPLSGTPRFEDAFMRNINFPKYQ